MPWLPITVGKTRDTLSSPKNIGQRQSGSVKRTKIGNAIRAHMTELGIIAAKGAECRSTERTSGLVGASDLHALDLTLRLTFRDEHADRAAGRRDRRPTSKVRQVNVWRRSPMLGMLAATIIAATTPDVDNFDCAGLCCMARPYAQTSLCGGKQKVGAISKMGTSAAAVS
ncbi:hypothetical protein SAMN03159288_04616 [Rhizobium sp. NFACC06-2]|nr:hypothetical protein SAMN03159288_04616 [Rhizobium sp. NFACC06-2]